MSINIGEVISVKGTIITVRVFEESNKETLFYQGTRFKGVSIREYLAIQRGFVDIICLVEGEYLDENRTEVSGDKTYFVRKVEAKPIGFFDRNEFKEGIKFMPMIKDLVSLLSEDRLVEIFGKKSNSDFVVGKLLKDDIPISLPWERLFNTHMGIFGNTGSGKSNTLAKLYTVLFENKLEEIKGKSTFVLLDFNGEYLGDQLLGKENKKVINLTTNSNTENEHKFHLHEQEFWNTETLSILFQASLSTQKPFLTRIVNGRKKFSTNQNSLLTYTKSIFSNVFTSASPKPDCLDLLRNISKLVGNEALYEKLNEIVWYTHNGDRKFKGPNYNEFYNADGDSYRYFLENIVNNTSLSIDEFDELRLRALIQLTKDLLHGFVQFEHIQPLLKRMDASVGSLKRVLSLSTDDSDDKVLTVISLRKCNQEMKKVLPLLIAKHFYNFQRERVSNPPDKTMHLIIDEAHNILSEQSSRESEGWKDYRLELFEEIIKEGRKFGMYVTISSQRPADISPTIVSQIHNFFIHRLVNDKDLFLLDNTISTLDRVSKNLIPNLSKGSCVITGTSFVLPLMLQIDILDKEKQPDSEDVDLVELWAKK